MNSKENQKRFRKMNDRQRTFANHMIEAIKRHNFGLTLEQAREAVEYAIDETIPCEP